MSPAFFILREYYMALKDKISDDMKAAMKSSDKMRLETLRTLRAVLMEKEIEKRGSGNPVSAEDEIAVLMTAAKKRKESIEQFEKGGRLDLVGQEQKELVIIQEYLPKQMSPEEIVQVIDEQAIQSGAMGASDFGKLMPLVMKQLKGKADGKLVQDLVRKRLGA